MVSECSSAPLLPLEIGAMTAFASAYSGIDE
jgi:hypothetical protein